MHKCINNSIGNIYHLEQFVGDFFPYSQKQLGFDKPVTIRFESDQDNAGVMLGKTAYYDPEAMEVVLYTDGRHPKDVMRSLSHELVHHAQNCRGDFTGQDSTGAGYAQSDPHLRKMEREAYTKGNLIFRDFEDLIKTGKINIEIDFSDSGEPAMSLKEWKDNEINTKLMKKWGFLKESKEVTTEDTEELEEGHEHGPECGCEEMEEGVWAGAGKYKQMADDEEDPKDVPAGPWGLGNVGPDPVKAKGNKLPDLHGAGGRTKVPQIKLEEEDEAKETYDYGEAEGHDEKELHDLVKRHATKSHINALKRDMSYDEDHERRGESGTDFREGKISIREVKEITRRIIERVRKEGK